MTSISAIESRGEPYQQPPYPRFDDEAPSRERRLSRDDITVAAIGAGVLIASGAALQYQRLIRK